MADTIPNIVIQPDTITDIYADPGVIAAGISVGDKINAGMIGQGVASFYAGAVAPAKIDTASGYRDLKANKEIVNETGDLGAFVYSLLGCEINVKAAV